VGVCIDGSGPYPFLVDSGASISVVSAAVARDLGLVTLGAPSGGAVVGCNSGGQAPVAVQSWSAGGLDLSPQTLVPSTVGSLGPGLSVAGLLGSDVLQRFGAVRVDYGRQTLEVETAESPPPASGATAQGAHAAPSPFDLTGTPRLEVTVNVLFDGGTVQVLAPVQIGHSTFGFLVDTGAGVVAASPAVASAGRLDRTGTLRLPSINCRASVPVYRGGRHWLLGGMALGDQRILGLPVSAFGLSGLLGSPVLSRFGTVAIDYARGQLVLGQ
jgi:predicted aspartyl protease